jgi:glutaminyl-tRNA synthetase
MVKEGNVYGWDDPRMPTISGMRRRGYSPNSIKNFCKKIGVAKVNSIIPIEFLEHCVRDDLNKTAPRYMGVLRPLKVVIENFPEGKNDMMDVVNNPENLEVGTRKVPFTKIIYIEQDDFMEKPIKKFYRLAPNREVRLSNAYLITCNNVIREGDNIKELRCTIDPLTRGGNAPNGRKVKSTLHWVSAKYALDAEVRIYDKLFTVPNPAGQKEEDFKDYLNKYSLKILKTCKVEPAVKDLKLFDRFQFLRKGYYCIDPDTTDDKLIINQTVGLRDAWARIQKN